MKAFDILNDTDGLEKLIESGSGRSSSTRIHHGPEKYLAASCGILGYQIKE
jgi:hypothetical protein